MKATMMLSDSYNPFTTPAISANCVTSPTSELKIICAVTSVQNASSCPYACLSSGSTAKTATEIFEVNPAMTIIGSRRRIIMGVSQASATE